MTAMREELRHLVELLPDEEVAPTLQLVRDRVLHAEANDDELPPFVGMVAAGPHWASTSEEVLMREFGGEDGEDR